MRSPGTNKLDELQFLLWQQRVHVHNGICDEYALAVINILLSSLWIIKAIVNMKNDNSYPNDWRSDGWNVDDQTQQRAEHFHVSAVNAALLQGQQTHSPPNANQVLSMSAGESVLLTVARRKACQQSGSWAKLWRMISSRARQSTAAISRGRTCWLDSPTFL